ncbi:aspartyl protease family protein At5g10770-like [Arachis hypogaea]|uniref:aspartyl protease family protein At5g10770-like n=1 Tax=Arachis hypogaea TaxID=3818 RepID=UPI003B21D436
MKEQEECPPPEEMKIDYWKKRMMLDDLRVRFNQNMFGRMASLSSSNQNLLPPSIYNALKEGFLRQFQGYPQVPGVAILDTCFDLTGIQQVKVPTIRMYFEGDNHAKLNVDPSGTLIMIDEGDGASKSKVCFPFASLSYEHEVPIIGNLQQRNNRVIYDSKLFRVGFAE